MDIKLGEILPEMFSRSQYMYLDFAAIPIDTPEDEDISVFFQKSQAKGKDPKLPENRQAFSNHVLDKTGKRYLVSRYGEDRIRMLEGSQIASEGRTLHMGIDIFSKNKEPVWSPCDGEIIRTGQEPGSHGYGYYMIFQPKGTDYFLFFGHLGPTMPHKGSVKARTHIAHLGDYKNNENGGWSRHLHLQVLRELPLEGQTPIGYSSEKDFPANSVLFPNPLELFPNWKIAG